jgi:hypothetical protein
MSNAPLNTTEPQNTPGAKGETKRRAVPIGAKWADPNGKVWEVVEILPFGMCRVRATDMGRVGEMSLRGVRLALATSEVQS